MTPVFADTLYWVALVRPNDPWRDAANQAFLAITNAEIVTTDEVLIEFLSSMSKGSAVIRQTAVQVVQTILADPGVRVIAQTHEGFMAGLSLFESRPDKQYSLTDCISMDVMKSEGIRAVLTNDHHFAQEGFQVLIEHGKRDV
ncbi:MAG: type II toxin-antitoxin system VapC family toxin [Planctomycetes bacterium]|nr:type II toxin-antitoxin system VapC family toxin [Planctomycetota bacterium]